MKKTLSGKIIKWVMLSVFLLVSIILFFNSFILKRTIERLSEEQLDILSSLNAQVTDGYLNGLFDITKTVASQLETVHPYARGSASKAFVSSFLKLNDKVQGVYVEWIKDEAYGGLKSTDELAKAYGIPEEYEGYQEIYAFRENGTISETIVCEPDFTEASYFMEAQQRNEPYIKSPYFDTYVGDVVVSAIAPIKDSNGKFLGCVGIDINSSILSQMKFENGYFDTSYSYLVSDNGMIITHSKENSLFGKDVSTLGVQEDAIVVEHDVKLSGIDDVWKSISAVKKSEISSNVGKAVTVVNMFSIPFQLILAFILYRILRRYLKPIGNIANNVERLSLGDLSADLSFKSNDELGLLSNSFNKLKNMIQLLTTRIEDVMIQIRNGDIEARIPDGEFDGDYKTTVNSINHLSTELIEDTLTVMNAFSELSSGNFSYELEKFPGKKAVLNEIFDSLKKNLYSINNDITVLIASATSGDLAKRIEANKYSGDWQKLTEGLNRLLEAVDRPIQESKEILAELSHGNFTVSVSSNYSGSFADMMNSFNQMIESTKSYISEISTILKSVAIGDLSCEIKREYEGQFSIIKESINQIAIILRNTVIGIQSSADSVLMGAGQVSTSSMNLSNGANEQASFVEELNASISQVNEQIQVTSSKSKKANEYSQNAMENAKICNKEMLLMLSSMNDIKTASNNTSKIIKDIEDIAFQTNLLALNAAVEAARAGEHGKGFSVVAEEVRSLSSRSSIAAKNTTNLIEETILKVNQGMKIAQETADSLKRIVLDTDSVSKIIIDINTAMTGQTEVISQINTGINQISEIVQTNSAVAEESAAAAEELNSQSDLLAHMVAKFKV